MKKLNIVVDISKLSDKQQTSAKMPVLGVLGALKKTLELFDMNTKLLKNDTSYSLIWTNTKPCKISLEKMAASFVNRLENQVKERRLYYDLVGCVYTENLKGELEAVEILEMA